MAEIILKYIQAILIWPVVVLVLGIMYRKDISEFLKRIIKGEAYGVKVEASSPLEQQEELKKNPLKLQTDTEIEKFVAEHPKEVIKEFIKISNGNWFERAYNIIYGSQISLLEYLSDKGTEGESYVNLISYYNTFVNQSGLNTTQMADYLGFLVNAKFIEYVGQGTDLKVKITPFGVDFLSYIKGQYSANYKFKPF